MPKNMRTSTFVSFLVVFLWLSGILGIWVAQRQNETEPVGWSPLYLVRATAALAPLQSPETVLALLPDSTGPTCDIDACRTIDLPCNTINTPTCEASCEGTCHEATCGQVTCQVTCAATCPATCAVTCAATCASTCPATCAVTCAATCASTCPATCAVTCAATCASTCPVTCANCSTSALTCDTTCSTCSDTCNCPQPTANCESVHYCATSDCTCNCDTLFCTCACSTQDCTCTRCDEATLDETCSCNTTDCTCDCNTTDCTCNCRTTECTCKILLPTTDATCDCKTTDTGCSRNETNEAGLDFGDAPDEAEILDDYPTRLESDGAWHGIVAGLFLGSGVDPDDQPQPSINADGDDILDGNDDEDGVLFTGPLEKGKVTGIAVIASRGGYLDAWVDFNGNRNWNDSSDQICSNVHLVAGVNIVLINVPSTATPGGTFARFRFSSWGGLLPYGGSPDGEVEDYRVVIH